MKPELHVERLRASLLGKASAVGEDGILPRAASGKVKIGPEHYDFAHFPELREYTNTPWYYDKHGYQWNMCREHAGFAGAEIEIVGRQVVNFSSYNYLDLSGDSRVQAASKQAIDVCGTSTGSGRIIIGEIPLYGEFERMLSEVLGVEDAMLGVSGYGTNVAAIGYLARKQDLVLYDELVHNSMLTGAKLNGACRFAFAHNDYDALERLLVEHRAHFE